VCGAPLLVFERVEIDRSISLESDLSRMSESPITKPHSMPTAPGFAFVSKVAAKKERLDPDTSPTHVLAGSVTRSNEVT
jgi:hypothetical protein